MSHSELREGYKKIAAEGMIDPEELKHTLKFQMHSAA